MIVYVSIPGFYAAHHPSDRPLVVVRARQALDANLLAQYAGVSRGMTLTQCKSILGKNPDSLPPVFVEWKEDAYSESQTKWLDRFVELTDVIEPVDQHAAYLDLSRHPHPESLIEANIDEKQEFGIGRTKWLAWSAWSIGDPERLAYHAPQAFLDALPISAASRLPEPIRERLAFLGYRWLGEIRDIPIPILTAQFGEEAHLLLALASGRIADPVLPLYPRHAIAERCHFENPVETIEPVANSIVQLSIRLSERLLSRGLQSKRMRLTLEKQTTERIFSKPLQSPRSIEFAANLLATLDRPISTLRIELIDLANVTHRQQGLYIQRTDSEADLDRSMNHVQKQFGLSALRRGADLTLTRRQQLLRTWKDATGWA
jgi:hypothetical protein